MIKGALFDNLFNEIFLKDCVNNRQKYACLTGMEFHYQCQCGKRRYTVDQQNGTRYNQDSFSLCQMYCAMQWFVFALKKC